ncbi:MAG: glycosyltransferase family 4 protein [Lentisphaeraceae bacterium]|nr:glycosyltransferase family 4 protein [Lentisphaeraceae bacterium]
MKILIVHEILGAFAGAEQNIFLTAGALKERGHELYLLYDKKSDQRLADFEELYTKTFQVSFCDKNKYAASELQKVLNEVKPDLAYLHKIMSIPLLQELVRVDTPIARMLHDHDTYCIRSYRYSPFSREICNRQAGLYCIFPCLGIIKRDRSKKIPISFVSIFKKKKEIALNKKFENIFVATPYMKEQAMIQGMKEENIHTLAPVPRSPQTDFQSTFSDKNILLFVGQIIRGKGVDCLLQSLVHVKSNFKVYIIGDGSHLQHCKSLATELGLDDRVVFTGWIQNEQLQEYYNDATLQVVPSTWPEPYGAVGLEAYRKSLPVVAFDSGGISDWLVDEETGFLIDWMDIEGFAAGIDKLLSDKILAKKLGQQGKQYGIKKYDFDRYIDHMEELFQKLAK